jgi:hypothetical protein
MLIQGPSCSGEAEEFLVARHCNSSDRFTDVFRPYRAINFDEAGADINASQKKLLDNPWPLVGFSDLSGVLKRLSGSSKRFVVGVGAIASRQPSSSRVKDCGSKSCNASYIEDRLPDRYAG